MAGTLPYLFETIAVLSVHYVVACKLLSHCLTTLSRYLCCSVRYFVTAAVAIRQTKDVVRDAFGQPIPAT